MSSKQNIDVPENPSVQLLDVMNPPTEENPTADVERTLESITTIEDQTLRQFSRLSHRKNKGTQGTIHKRHQNLK